ncbi:MAG: hypothetical protein V2I47_02285 [Bacteroidales bacterium]|nr:hypothetical protein [Bacteroidales bacterium]
MKQTLTLIILFSSFIAFSQQFERTDVPRGMQNTAPLTDRDASILDKIEPLVLPPHYRSKSLPDSIDNSEYDWFRPIFSQESYPNCMQSTSIAYNFTYEINRLRDVPGDVPENQYTTHFAWNFFNGGNGWFGVNYLFTMDVLKNHGTPNVTDYGGFYYGGGQRWMSGYDEWHNAMNNRISGIKKIYVGDEEGILTLKHWLNDHLDGSTSGGLASFIASSPWNINHLPAGTPNAYKAVVTEWFPSAVHGMTIVGYNDSIRYDFNGDGVYTNDIDINNDGAVDVHDWEIGGVKFCNSYGITWADSGFCYMMYKTLAEDFYQGGIWSSTVHVLEAKEGHETQMTYKVNLEHDYREGIRIQAGISSDIESNRPEHIQSFTIFNYQGGWHYMQGIDTASSYKTIEFGLDVSPLLSYVEPGQPYKFFLMVDEKDPDNLGSGQLNSFSLFDYRDGITEIECDQQNVPIVDNGKTFLTLVYEPDPYDLEVVTQDLPLYEAGQNMSVQLEASGGLQPYEWKLDRNYLMNVTEGDFPDVDEEQLITDSWPDSIAVKTLDFSFPFYGNKFKNVVVSSSGYLFFDENMYFWSYISDNDYFLKNSRVVTPLFCQDMFVHPGGDEGVWYEGDSTRATFRWKNSPEDEEEGELNFAVSLHADGKIEFYYDEMALEDPIRWSAGISDGDYYNYSFPALPTPPHIPSGTMVEFLPVPTPGYVTLSKTGELEIVEPEQGMIRQVKVAVVDDAHISAGKLFLITEELEYDLYLDGSPELLLNSGEILHLDLHVRNRGDQLLEDIVFDLSCQHPMMSLPGDTYVLDQLNPGETVLIPQAFELESSELLEDGQNVILKLDASANGLDYSRDISILSMAPDIDLDDYHIDNEMNILEPGQTEDLTITLTNWGSNASENTTVELTCQHEGITINTPQPYNVGSIDSWGTTEFNISLTASPTILHGEKADFELSISSDNGMLTQESFTLRIGRTPVYVIDLDMSVASGLGIYNLLQDMGVESEYTASFPTYINNYQSVFICTGKLFTSYTLTWQQGELLSDFLDNGGNIYMEGRAVWQQQPYLPVFDRFGLTTVTEPLGFGIIDGVEGTFTEGMAYENTAQTPLSLFYLVPEPPAYSIFTGRDYPQSAAVAYDEGSYKTIGTIFEFGSLLSSDTCQLETLMDSILQFFELSYDATGIDELPANISGKELQSYPNPFSHITHIPFKLDQRSSVDAAVYDLRGRRIYELAPATTLEAGNYTFKWDGSNQQGQAVPGGIYIARIIAEGVRYTGKMVLIP